MGDLRLKIIHVFINLRPFVEATVSIPQSNSVRCTERTLRVSMAPLTGYHVKNTVAFRFRGTYDIGVRCFYVYDFFRIFRARVDVDSFTTVYVLPRRLTQEDTEAHSISDDTVRTVRSPLVVDKLEVSDIRDYRNGDSLKSIHWKLSSKSESFIVKDYNTGKGVQRYRCWDSCMYSDFTMMAHGNNRTSQLQRYRQRFMHKLVYFPANNDGMYSCVGCGRCVDKCPASTNIVKVIKAFQKEGK